MQRNKQTESKKPTQDRRKINDQMSRPASFAVSRPGPSSRAPVFGHDSDNDSADDKDELISGFDARGRAVVSRSNGSTSRSSAVSSKGLVIPSQPNKDWKQEAARLRGNKRPSTYLPDEAKSNGPALTPEQSREADRMTAVVTGGLSIKPSISSSGTITPRTEVANALASTSLASAAPSPLASGPITLITEQPSADELALKELLQGANGETDQVQQLDAILQAKDSFAVGQAKEQDEQDSFKRDIESRPDTVRLLALNTLDISDDEPKQSSMEDYERVPVDLFGAALLRGMGHGTDPTYKATEAYIPKARPSLLGIGAKALAAPPTDGKAGSSSKKKSSRRDDMKFVPLTRREVVSTSDRSGSNVSASNRSTITS